MTTAPPAKDKIIVPLDVPGAEAAVRLVHQLSGVTSFYKVGLELFTRCGPSIVGEVRAAAGGPCRIFLDLKLHDIPNTVRHAVRAAVVLGIDMLTVHLSGGGAMVRAAAEEAGDKLLLLGVSVLTSIDEATLGQTGVAGSVEEQVLRLAVLGAENGVGGVVASPLEIRALRAHFGDALKLVIPGVRPASTSTGVQDDQRRVLTPREAVRAGADFLVIGRPITAQPDPRQAARQIVEEIEGAGAATE